MTVLNWPPESPALNSEENLWDVVEREIHIVDIQLTNVKQLHHAIAAHLFKWV